MVIAHDRDESLWNRGQNSDCGAHGCAVDDREIDVVVDQSIDRGIVVHDLDVEHEARIGLSEIADLGGQEVERKCLTAGDFHGTTA